jgi:hypothetical protein
VDTLIHFTLSMTLSSNVIGMFDNIFYVVCHKGNGHHNFGYEIVIFDFLHHKVSVYPICNGS